MARYIDADALIHRICEERDGVKIEHACDIGYHNGLNMAASMTINAPTIEARPVVRGEWNIVEVNKQTNTITVECNECGAVLDLDMFLFGLSYNFCPSCGADMRGENNEAD